EAYGKMDINKEGIKLYMLSSTINPVEIKRFELNQLVTKFIGKALTPTMIKSLKLNAVK
ncbi:MAG: hypothetical protein JWQ06_295, partial [Mucilaginibacter sp.]|nr:hypothetical protein [Mucilaginibacter sp.]